MIISKLSRRVRATIPWAVRASLHLTYKYRVAVTRVWGGYAEDPFTTFSEWAGDADRAAYAKL